MNLTDWISDLIRYRADTAALEVIWRNGMKTFPQMIRSDHG
ncbi:hypothetical protein STTU_0788 [Streptomyces sp. Tu6071]|nr:hypothetical protein STTU_0788 [Streptomyces sp. Tu6071]